MSGRYSTVIAGVGYYVPPKVISSAFIEEQLGFRERFGFPSGIIERLSGVRERRYVADDEACSDLAVRASEMCLAGAKIAPAEIDLLIFAATSQDLGEPATANLLQAKLGASNAQVFDVKNACNSFINALDIVDAFMATGRCEVALVASGEVLSKFVKWDLRTLEDLRTGFAGLTLGDGAGAVVLRRSEEQDRGIRASCYTSDGSQWRLAILPGAGTLFDPFDPSHYYFVSDSEKLQKVAIEMLPPIILETLEKTGWKAGEVDLVIPHQVSIRVVRKISSIVGIPFERCLITIDRFGNTAAASMPMGLAVACNSGLLRRGAKLLFVGGASGFSAGAMSLVW
jgi:3-oxoacyl-[acyl-carrier-protein] synthase-3